MKTADELSELLEKHQEMLRYKNNLKQEMQKLIIEISNVSREIKLIENEILELEEKE